MKEIYFKPLYESGLERTTILEYNRVADCLLGGIVEGLMSQGYTEKMAICFLSSKILRCELDGGLDDSLLKFGKRYAKKMAESYRDDCKRYAEEG